MKFKQTTSLVALSFLFLSAEAFAGKGGPESKEDDNTGGGSKTVTAKPKSGGSEGKTTDANEEGTSSSAEKVIVLSQGSPEEEQDTPSVSATSTPSSPFGDLTKSVWGQVRDVSVDTRGYTLEWLAPTILGGRDRLHDFTDLRAELATVETPEISDAGYSAQIAQFTENSIDPKVWPADTRAWYTQNGADIEWVQTEAKRLVKEGKLNVRQWPVEVQKMIVTAEHIRTLSPWMNEESVKLNFRAK